MIDRTRRILLSVKPRFAELILDGVKTVELRRTRPRIHVPTEALIYASSPDRAVLGTCHVTHVLEYTPLGLWRLVGSQAAIDYREYCAYFEGAKTAYGLVIANAARLSSEVTLATIRTGWRGFQPPQSFRYLTPARGDQVLAFAS